jgi:adenylosuccinate lyase
MATENIMMDAVKNGGNRQELHEKIRTLSMEAGRHVKEEGRDNDLLDMIAADPDFNMSLDDLKASLKPENYVGRAPRQVEVYLRDVVRPVLDANKDVLGLDAEINV